MRLLERLEAERIAGNEGNAPKAPEQELQRLSSLAKRIGITRLADLTGLDRLGCPIVQAVRPGSLSNVTSQGKGMSLFDAARSAVMEAAEAWAAECATATLTGTPYVDLDSADRSRLERLGTLAVHADWREQELDWIAAESLAEGTATWVPLTLVSTDYRIAVGPRIQAFVESSTGLGAGYSFHQACLHGLLECIERDAVARAKRTHGFLERSLIDLKSSGGEIAELVRQVEGKGCLVAAWAAPAQIPVSVIWCWIMERDRPDRLLPYAAEGMACAPDPTDAALKALLEAAQARVTLISGAREDITRRAYRSAAPEERRGREALMETSRSRRCLQELSSPSLDTPATWLRWAVEELRRSGNGPVLAVVLATPEDLGVAVVRIVVPGLTALTC